MKILSDDGIDIWFELPCGLKTVIDKRDEWIFTEFTQFSSDGTKCNYVSLGKVYETKYGPLLQKVKAHRAIMIHYSEYKHTAHFEVDHIDRDTSNNRSSNLRWATRTLNQANTRPKNPLGFKGVFKNKLINNSFSYTAVISMGRGKKTTLGTFKTLKEAAIAYDVEAKKRYGNFALLNFPDQTESTSKIINAAPAL